MQEWTSFLSAMTLALVRVSGMVAFAPFFSSSSLPLRTKAVFAGAVAYLLAPLVATLPRAQSVDQLLRLTRRAGSGTGLRTDTGAAKRDAALCRADRRHAVQLFAGQSSRPDSAIQTPLLGDLFQLLGTLVVIGAGLDRILLASMVRSFRAAPLGAYRLGSGNCARHRARRQWHLSGRRRAGRASAGRNHAGRGCRGPARQAQPAVAGDEPDRALQDPYRLCTPNRLSGPVAALH